MPVLLAHNVFPAVWPGIALALLVLVAAFADRMGRWGGAALVALSIYWLTNNKGVEGGTLIVLTKTHGLNATDLVGVVGLGLGGWLLLKGRLPR